MHTDLHRPIRSQGQEMDLMPPDMNRLGGIRRAPSHHHLAISLSVPFIVEIKCVTAASLETKVDMKGNGEISAQLAFWLTGFGKLKA